MKKTRTNAQLTRLKMNTGQIDWLPKNPRQWDSDDLDRTFASIVEDPDFLEDRPMLAVENGKDLIVFAGNLRLSAIRKTEYKTAPVVIYEPETDEDRETVKRRAMKDNGEFGSWDWDTLANEWQDEVDKLADWGVETPGYFGGEDIDVGGLFDESKKAGKEPTLAITISIPKEWEGSIEEIRDKVQTVLETYAGLKIK